MRKDTVRLGGVGVEDEVPAAFLDHPWNTRPRAVEILGLTSGYTHGVVTNVWAGEGRHAVLARYRGGGGGGALS